MDGFAGEFGVIMSILGFEDFVNFWPFIEFLAPEFFQVLELFLELFFLAGPSFFEVESFLLFPEVFSFDFFCPFIKIAIEISIFWNQEF